MSGIRELARDGRLAAVAASAVGGERRALTGAAYDVAWPVVFTRLTRRFEQRRGHAACSVAVNRLADDCLDRFHDDVEAVVDDLLLHARQPIRDVEAWIASRLTVATVDGHRRSRGRRGALQRPRVPAWLAGALGQDRWLTALATEVLVWVGVPATAGTGVWPLDAWAQRRAAATGDWQGSDPATVAREVDTVLAAMRHRPGWYADYVERPLGRKRAPLVVGAPPTLAATAPADDDAELTLQAAAAVQAIEARVARGEPVRAAAVDVIATVFGDEVAARALAERATVDRIVAAATGIVIARPSQARRGSGQLRPDAVPPPRAPDRIERRSSIDWSTS
jgi:hypothetical protein